MRVSDRSTVKNFLNYLDRAKTNYSKTNARIASGNRFERISDDVSAGSRVLRVRSELNKSQKYYSTVKTINEELSVTETGLMCINDKLTEAHTRILRAMNSPTSESGRKTLANEISSIKKEIMQYANTKYNHKFVLGGSKASAPFSVDSAGKLLYNGIDVDTITQSATGDYFYKDDAGIDQPVPMDGDIFADIGLGLRMTGSDVLSDTAFKVSYSGLEVMGCGLGNDGTPNNLFNLLTEVEGAMRSNNLEKLGTLDGLLVKQTDSFGRHITDIGSKTSFLDSVESRVTSSIDSYKRQINNLMGINDAEETMNQTMNDYVLKAVLQMGSEILPVSLIDFLH